MPTDTWTHLPLLTETMQSRGLPVRDCWQLPRGGIAVRWSCPWPDEFVLDLARFFAMSDDVWFLAPSYVINGAR